MTDYLTIGSTPCDEDCQQLGPNYDDAKARIEERAFAQQIVRVYGEPPTGAGIRVKSFPHDFGTYREVCVTYDESNEEAVAYAFAVEADDKHGLQMWDDEAKAFIADQIATLEQQRAEAAQELVRRAAEHVLGRSIPRREAK